MSPAPRRAHPRRYAGALDARVGPHLRRPALGVCLFTYNDSLNIGFACDRRMIPDPDNLAAHVRRHVDDLVATGAAR